MTELLPCPFCGSDRVDYFGAPGKGYRVECKGCLAQSGWGDYGYQVKPQWNTRVATPAVGGAMIPELYDASNACLELCSNHGFATGHGDTVADMIREIDRQITTPAVGGEDDMGIMDCHCPACGFDFFKEISAQPATPAVDRPPCPVCHNPYRLEGAERYWEARWRDEKAENERLRAVAPPSVGGEREALEKILQRLRGPASAQTSDIRKIVQDTLAQPASPLRGREALVDLVDAVECELDIEYRSFAFRKRFSAAKAALASPPEQPSNEWPEHAVSTDRLNQLVRWANDPNSTYAELSKSDTHAQPEYLSGCFHKTGPDSCQSLGGCQSEACDHYNKTEYRPRMTLLAQVDGVLYPKVEK